VLSYQHDYHAGNHADVLKHWLLVECVRYMQRKAAGFEYIDTHAGSGRYQLDSPLALKTAEHQQGIMRLLQQPLPEMTDYLTLVQAAVAAKRYPGSPGLVNELLRPQDRSWLFELHPQAFKELEKNCARRKRVFVRQADGFTGLLSLLPVASKRALVLIDPAYEVKDDYATVVTLLQAAVKKMPQATFMLWYPVVDKDRVRRLESDLAKAALPNLTQFELSVRDYVAGNGMSGSGVMIVNPPYTLKEAADAVLPRLSALLAGDGVSRFCSNLVA
jgi:23S rRNA (adenine2030-N6)-methyltransferase